MESLFSANPALDAWNGARRFSLSPYMNLYSINRSEYEEKGPEYMKEHFVSNRYIPTPVLSSREMDATV